MAFADRLVFARKQKKVNQSDLGRTIGTYRQYEQIDNNTLKKLKAMQELDSYTKAHIFATINAFIKAAKIKNIAAL